MYLNQSIVSAPVADAQAGLGQAKMSNKIDTYLMPTMAMIPPTGGLCSQTTQRLLYIPTRLSIYNQSTSLPKADYSLRTHTHRVIFILIDIFAHLILAQGSRATSGDAILQQYRGAWHKTNHI